MLKAVGSGSDNVVVMTGVDVVELVVVVVVVSCVVDVVVAEKHITVKPVLSHHPFI